jgi:serine/threonine protein kinase
MTSTLPVRAAWGGYQRLRTLASGGSGQVFLARGSTTTTTNSTREGGGTTVAPVAAAAAAAVVVLKRIFIDSDETLHLAEQEIDVMMHRVPQHDNCTAILDAFVDDDGAGQRHANIVLEHSVVGDLDRVLRAKREVAASAAEPQLFSVDDVIFIAAQLLVALRHLHRHRVVHRDIKPANIFLDFVWRTSSNNNNNDDGNDDINGLPTTATTNTGCALRRLLTCSRRRAYLKRIRSATTTHDGDAGETEFASPSWDCSPDGDDLVGCSACTARVQLRECVARVGDFGVSRTLASTTSRANTVVGTPFYVAPELCENAPYSAPADIWGFGATIWELACCGAERLFSGDNMLSVVRQITSGKPAREVLAAPLPSNGGGRSFEAEMRPLLDCTIVADPSRRATADEMLTKFFGAKPSVG